jgi:hypothetical protein
MPTQVPKIEIHDENARIVKGFGTVDVFDNANERLPIDEFKRIMPVIMKRGGLIMNRHTNQSVAKILNYEFKMKDTPVGPREGVYLTTEVFKDFGSDDQVWADIKKGEVEGFSFGGKNNREELDFSKGLTQKVLKELEGFEFSYVPKGCNKEATIEEVNFIAKEDKPIKKEDGETSTDSDHYHLYRIDESGDGKTLGTLPRETEEHTHLIESGIVVLENGHSHELIRMLVNKVKKGFAGFKDFDACVSANQDKDDPKAFCGFLQARVEKIEKEYESDEKKKIENTSDSTKTEHKESDTDDKIEKESQSKDDLTLLNRDNKDETYIKKNILNKNMAEEETKKPEDEKKVEKVEEAPMAADSVPTEDPMAVLSSKMDKIIELLSVNKVEEPVEVVKEKEVEKEEDEEKDKDKDKDVEKEGDGEEVKLPESEGDEVSQDKPAEGAVSDKPEANFLEKEGIEKIKEDMKADIMKELINKKADTPRAGIKTNEIKKTEIAAPKTSIEANKMIKAAGLQ